MLYKNHSLNQINIVTVYDILCTVAAAVVNTRCSCMFHLLLFRKGLPLGMGHYMSIFELRDSSCLCA